MNARRPGRFLLALPLLAAPAGLHAQQAVDVPCRLPENATIRLTNEQRGWSADGKPWTVTLTQPLRFEPDLAGARLTLGPVTAGGTLDADARRRMAGAFAPDGQAPRVLRLDRQGRITALEDLDSHWQAYLGRIERLADALEADGRSSERTRAMLAALRGTDETARLAILAGNAGPLLRHCGQTVERTQRADGMIVVEQQADRPELVETTRYLIDAHTGLARSIERRIIVKARPDRPQLEHWRFDPID